MPLTVDLTGLPEPVVRQVHSIVDRARQESPGSVPAALSPRYVSDPNPTLEEFRALLEQMASRSSGQSLPADFSRADIYDDHD